METGFLQVLLNPGRFFESRMQEEPSLKVPALIALVCGLIGAVSTLMMADITVAMLPAEMKGLGWLLVAFSVAVALIGGFLAWIIYGFIFHIISMAFKGQGSQSDSGGHGLWIPPSGLWWHNRVDLFIPPTLRPDGPGHEQC